MKALARMIAVPLFTCTLAHAQEERCLTENGQHNEKYSEYADTPMLETGGRYLCRPAFTSPPAAETRWPQSFAEGALTNGDSSFDYKRKPGPYSYWQGVQRGELEFDLLKPYRVTRVRVCVLNSGPHGTAKIELFQLGDPLEFPDLLRMGEVEAQDGWNEFAGLNKVCGGVRLRLTVEKGKQYLTVSEVEVWGAEAPAGARVATPRKRDAKSIVEDGIEWHAFDFGPVTSPTFANFTGVSKDDAYTVERGYGWVPQRGGEAGTASNFGPESADVPGLGERDRAAKPGATGDDLYRDFVSATEYYHTQVRQTFRLEVPDGKYRVMTFHGDSEYGRPGEQCWWIEANGKRVVEKLDMPASLTAEVVFDVQATGGKLELTFDAANEDPAKRSFLLNGLVVLPANNDREVAFADEKIPKVREAVVRQRKEMFDATFTENPYVEEAEMPAVSAEDTARGYVPFVPNWMTNVYPNSVPRPEDLTRPLGCFACPGEYEPMAVAVRSLKPIEKLSCTVGDLDGPGRIPASAVDVRTVKCWPQRLGSSWSTEWRVMPELLEAKTSADVPGDTALEFWLTIRVPDDTKPGAYRGKATLTAANAGTTEIPLTVEVLPFRLQPNERPVGMYWYEDLVAGTPLRDAQVRDMVAHGMTTLTMGRLLPEATMVNGKLVLDVSELRTFLQDLKRLGIEGPIPYQTAGLPNRLKRAAPGKTDAEYDELYVEAIRQLEAVSSRPDTPQLLYYPVDEIGNHDERGEKANHECALTARVPGATSYITVNNYAAGEKWGDTFDIWCGNIVYTTEQEQKLLASGKRYMRYGSAYLNDPRKTRASTGFGFYARPAEAMFYWHYQAYRQDPFNDFDANSRDWCAAYPGANGKLIPTTDWEGIREGVDDMRYLATLKHYAELAAKSAASKSNADRALALVADLLTCEPDQPQSSFRDDLSNDDYHELRRKLVDAIIELRRTVGGEVE